MQSPYWGKNNSIEFLIYFCNFNPNFHRLCWFYTIIFPLAGFIHQFLVKWWVFISVLIKLLIISVEVTEDEKEPSLYSSDQISCIKSNFGDLGLSTTPQLSPTQSSRRQSFERVECTSTISEEYRNGGYIETYNQFYGEYRTFENGGEYDHVDQQMYQNDSSLYDEQLSYNSRPNDRAKSGFLRLVWDIFYLCYLLNWTWDWWHGKSEIPFYQSVPLYWTFFVSH